MLPSQTGILYNRRSNPSWTPADLSGVISGIRWFDATQTSTLSFVFVTYAGANATGTLGDNIVSTFLDLETMPTKLQAGNIIRFAGPGMDTTEYRVESLDGVTNFVISPGLTTELPGTDIDIEVKVAESWLDASGSLEGVLQHSALQAPYFLQGVQNGLDCLWFYQHSFTNGTTWWADVLANNYYLSTYFAGTLESGSSGGRLVSLGENAGFPEEVSLMCIVEDGEEMTANQGGTYCATVATPVYSTLNIASSIDYDEHRIRNHSALGATPPAGIDITSVNGLWLTIGSNNDLTGAFYQGRMSEIVLLAATTPAWVRLYIEGYFAHKYGTQGDLPLSHPFRHVAPVSP